MISEMTAPYGFVMQWMVLITGCCLGSFYNVVIHRLPAGKSLILPGSHCPQCRKPIAFYDNIPLLSYVLLMGKCRECGAAISLRYPVVEGLTGFMGLMLFRLYGFQPQFFIDSIFVSLLVVISFIDLDTYTIPNVLSLPGIVAGVVLSPFAERITWLDSVAGGLLGGGFLYLIAVVYQLVRKQEGMGMGDVKLLGMIGAFEGAMGVVFTVLAASVVGTLIGGVAMWRTRKGLNTMLPFGPFLSLGALCYLFWGPALIRWYIDVALAK